MFVANLKEGIMVEVTPSAAQQITEYFKGKDVTPIRIFLNEGGWGGPSLGMALDEPKDNDSVFDVEGFQYLVDNDLLEKAKSIKVDFLQVGFKIDSNLTFGSESGCEGCSCS